MTKLYGFEKWVFDLEKWIKVAESGSVSLGPPGVHPYLYWFHVYPLNLVCEEERKRKE